MKPSIKHIITLILLLFTTLVFAQTNSKHVHVKGYYKSNGTYVAPHYRTAPNSSNRDNFSTKPNTNPYTGKKGYIEPDNKSLNSTYSNYSSNSTNSSYSSSNNYTNKSTNTKSSNTITNTTSTYNNSVVYNPYRFINKAYIIHKDSKEKAYIGYLKRFDAKNILEKYKMYSNYDEYLGYVVFFSDGSYFVYDKAGKIMR